MGKYKNINHPFQWLSMDIIGPYPRIKNENKYALIITDWFTKFCFAHPISKATAASITKFIETHIFNIFGIC